LILIEDYIQIILW